MTYKYSRLKGFTLIEILIVVIIIAILAALIIPRYFSQSEKAYMAEARQMLGAINRAQVNTMQLSEATNFLPITDCPVSAACDADEWKAIGMKAPDTNPNGAFDYSCPSGAFYTACVATRRQAGGPNDGWQVGLSFDPNTSATVWGCTAEDEAWCPVD